MIPTTFSRPVSQNKNRLVQILRELKQVQQELLAANREHAYLLHRLGALQHALAEDKTTERS